MRPILLGPFGSMGSMNMKMRNICVEDLTLETILLLIAVVRVWTADTFYEEIGGWGAVLSASTIACTLSMLVLDNGIQCMCCRKKPLCTWLCFGCINGSQIISDKSLMRLLLIVTQLGILSAVVTVITETCTFFDTAELRRHVVKMPKNYIGLHDYMEWHHAIAMIVVQVRIPGYNWRHTHDYIISVSFTAVGVRIHSVALLCLSSHERSSACHSLCGSPQVSFGLQWRCPSQAPTQEGTVFISHHSQDITYIHHGIKRILIYISIVVNIIYSLLCEYGAGRCFQCGTGQ